MIKQWGRELGFDLVGIAPAGPIEMAEQWREYLRRDYQGEMDYLARSVEKRIDVRQLVLGACSVICLGLTYNAPPPPRPGGRSCGLVARYARGSDYHGVVKARLQKLEGSISQP